MAKKFTKSVSFYHPNKQNTGAAASFEYRYDNVKGQHLLFMNMAKQKTVGDPASFDWDNKVIVKMGENDIGDFLAVLNGDKSEVGSGGKYAGLFHKNSKGNKSIGFKKLDNAYSLSVSQQESGDLTKMGMSVYITEAQILKVMLERFVELYYGWGEADPDDGSQQS